MKTFYECIPCFINQTIDVSKMLSDKHEELLDQILNKVLKIIMDSDKTVAPPIIARYIHRLIKEVAGNPDPYKRLKDKYNDAALDLYEELKDIVNKAEDQFASAVKLAVAGNIIDFGVYNPSGEICLVDSVYQVIQQNPFIDCTKELKNEIDKSSKILYLGDNTGEIVFDKVFIEHLMPKNIVFAVRQTPILNDATYEDAEYVGLTKLVKVIENGTDVPGTYLEECSDEFLDEFETADLIISKGQGNFETLSHIDKNIFFLLKAKCSCVADYVGCKYNDILVIGKQYVCQNF